MVKDKPKAAAAAVATAAADVVKDTPKRLCHYDALYEEKGLCCTNKKCTYKHDDTIPQAVRKALLKQYEHAQAQAPAEAETVAQAPVQAQTKTSTKPCIFDAEYEETGKCCLKPECTFKHDPTIPEEVRQAFRKRAQRAKERKEKEQATQPQVGQQAQNAVPPITPALMQQALQTFQALFMAQPTTVSNNTASTGKEKAKTHKARKP